MKRDKDVIFMVASYGPRFISQVACQCARCSLFLACAKTVSRGDTLRDENNFFVSNT